MCNVVISLLPLRAITCRGLPVPPLEHTCTVSVPLLDSEIVNASAVTVGVCVIVGRGCRVAVSVYRTCVAVAVRVAVAISDGVAPGVHEREALRGGVGDGVGGMGAVAVAVTSRLCVRPTLVAVAVGGLAVRLGGEVAVAVGKGLPKGERVGVADSVQLLDGVRVCASVAARVGVGLALWVRVGNKGKEAVDDG